MTVTPPPSDTRPIGYLTSEYPAPSHTFIRREVAALERRGLSIRTFAVRKADAGLTSELDRGEAERTFQILAQSPLAIATAHLSALLRHPLRYLRTWALAWRHRVPGARALLWSQFHFVEAIVLARALRRTGVRHLHNHFANSGATVGMLAAHFAELPWSLTLHGISETDYPAGLLLGRKIAAADWVACVSRFGMAQAMRVSDSADFAKLSIVRCGIDLDTLPAKARSTVDGTCRIICVGRLSPEKGQFGLLEAFAALRDDGADARLTFVGSGPLDASLRAEAARLGVTDAITFTGRLDERATLSAIADADMLVLPSFMEGLPVVLMEAMAIGVPVVASRVAGIPELVEDGVTGLLFHPTDWNDLRIKVARLIDDPSLARVLTAAAKPVIEREFAIDAAVEPLVQRYGAGKPQP